MSQHEVSFFDPKMVTLKGKKGHLIFRHTQTRKKHVLQQWQWIVFGSAKLAQDEKPKTRRKMKPTNAKTTTQSNKSKNVKTIVQNLSAASFMKLRGVHVNSRVLIAHGCSCVFFIFFGCHPFSLLSGFPCPKRKIKVIFREVRARFWGINWLPPGARTQPKKHV